MTEKAVTVGKDFLAEYSASQGCVELILLVQNQMYVFLWSTAGGILTAFLFDLFRIKRKTIKTSAFMVYVEDLIFWILATIIVFLIAHFFNNGELRSYIFIGTLVGVSIYICLFSRVITTAVLKIIQMITVSVLFIYKLFIYPIRIIIKITLIPIYFIKKKYVLSKVKLHKLFEKKPNIRN